MKTQYFDGETIERGGRQFRVNIEPDYDMGAPWKEHDGHGVISEMVRRDKLPGERILYSDNGCQYFYHVAATMKIAKCDGWGLSVENINSLARKLGRVPTRGEVVAEAVDRDFQHLAAWCNEQWTWCGVIVSDITGDKSAKPDYVHGVWGFESSDDHGIAECVDELVSQCLSEHAETVKQARKEYHAANAEALALIREIKGQGAIFPPAICQALRLRLSGLLAGRASCFNVISEGV
jgi:hypothetical protein